MTKYVLEPVPNTEKWRVVKYFGQRILYTMPLSYDSAVKVQQTLIAVDKGFMR